MTEHALSVEEVSICLGEVHGGVAGAAAMASGVRQATIFGQSVLALVDVDRSDAELGLSGLKVRSAEASLEDVFVTLAKAQVTS